MDTQDGHGSSAVDADDTGSATALVQRIDAWARELGFSQTGVAGIDLSDCEPRLQQWLAQGFHGQMHYMHLHGTKRTRPAELVPGTVSIITARMDYLPADTPQHWQQMERQRLLRTDEAVISIYARGRDYHKVVRNRLQKLAHRIAQTVGPFGHRVFCDSAPVMEKPLALRSGLGWRGKHSIVLSRNGGSTFFLGEIYTDMPLPPTAATTAHCGSCSDCIHACPTGAIVAPYVVDARRCISYLTMVHEGSLPLELRPLMGNRIYGCDDCQNACPWNKFAQPSTLADFAAREGMSSPALENVFAWDEATFLRRTEGSAIRHMGHTRWLRNIAVAMGNALRIAALPPDRAAALRRALQQRAYDPCDTVREHVQWALAQENTAPSQQPTAAPATSAAASP